MAGIKPHQLEPTDDAFTAVEELVACHIATEGSMPRAELLKRFSQLARANVLSTPPTRRNRRIFIERSAAKRRKTANQKELEPVLTERGFEIVQWEQLSMPEQVRLAAETAVMAGPHGTSLLNSIYSEPGAKVLEIINPHWWDAATLRQCTLMGHEFWYCFGENVSKEHDMAIEPRKLARVLDCMLDRPQTDPLFDETRQRRVDNAMKDLILADLASVTPSSNCIPSCGRFRRRVSMEKSSSSSGAPAFGSTNWPASCEGVTLIPFFYPFKRAHKMRNPLHRWWPRAQRFAASSMDSAEKLLRWSMPFHNLSSLRYLLYSPLPPVEARCVSQHLSHRFAGREFSGKSISAGGAREAAFLRRGAAEHHWFLPEQFSLDPRVFWRRDVERLVRKADHLLGDHVGRLSIDHDLPGEVHPDLAPGPQPQVGGCGSGHSQLPRLHGIAVVGDALPQSRSRKY